MHVVAQVRLPAEIVAEDVLSLHDQLEHRVAALLTRPTPRAAHGRRHAAADVAAAASAILPAGVTTMESLPDHLGGPWQRFTDAIAALDAERTARAEAAQDPHVPATVEEERAAKLASDHAWRAVATWLDGWSLADDDGHTPTPADAHALYMVVFAPPLGLRFISRRPRRRWEDMKSKMATLAKDASRAVVHGLGGQRLYDQLLAAHTRFGNAYGFLKVVVETGQVNEDTRPELLAAKEALRDLLRKVESYAEPSVPGSEALAAFLMQPYQDLVTELATAQRRRAATNPSPATPATPATPVSGAA
jgi:hypothetical protein